MCAAWAAMLYSKSFPFARTLGNSMPKLKTHKGEQAKNGPFGGPIAHGYLTLSLAPVFLRRNTPRRRHLDGRELRLQQGPLPSPVMVGSKLRSGRRRWPRSKT